MAKNTNEVTIEIDGQHNENYRFDPLQQNVRGRWDAHRVMNFDDGASRLSREWNEQIPGQHLTLNYITGEAILSEPLFDDQHDALREKIEARGFTIQKSQQFDSVDIATWSYWLRRAVESGHARIVSGEFPDSIEGTPKTSFIVNRQPDTLDKLTEAIERQAQAFDKLANALLKK